MPVHYTPTSNIEQKRAIARSLMQSPSNQTGHWAGALADIINGYTAGKSLRDANQAEKDNTQLYQDELRRVLYPHEAQEVTPGQINGAAPGMEQQAADFWSGVSQDRAQADANFTPSHPAILEAMMGQKQRMEQIDAQTARYGAQPIRQFAGDPVLDKDRGNQIVGYAQSRTGGAPIVYGLDGQPLAMTPSMYVMPSAAMADITPEVLGTATEQQAATAGDIEAAEQTAMTEGALNRAQGESDIDIEENLIIGHQNTDLENLGELSDSARYAQQTIDSLQRIRAENADGELPSGSLGNMMSIIGGIFESAGIPNEMYTSANVLEANANQILANYMRELGPRGLTDPDIIILNNTLPNLTRSAEAREQIIDVLIRRAQNQIQRYQDTRDAYTDQYEQAPVSLYQPQPQAQPQPAAEAQTMTLSDGTTVTIRRND